jgi:methylphosphotriester-DNA--protein-cysteine methyltransferase
MVIQTIERDEMTAADLEQMWERANSKDTTMDGVFYIAVKTTGV